MLNLSNIEKYYPKNEQPFKRNILREYLQYKILEIIFNSKIGKELTFLGGTALRIIHGNSRFSEDLDFDNFGITESQFTTLTDEIKRDLILQGYKVEIRNVFKGAYRSYIKMPGILFDNNMSSFQEEKIMIQIDTVPHVFDYERDLKIINKFNVFTQVYVTPIDILLSQKMYASINRKRAKGRDFFDIVFLLQKTKPNYEYLEKKIGVKNWQELKNELLLRVSELDFNELAKDVEPFLVNSRDSNKVQNFTQYIKEKMI